MDQVLDWLNENELRSFPLLSSADKTIALTALETLPEDFLLDLQISVPIDISSTSVALIKIQRTSTHLLVEFGTSITTLAAFVIPSPATATYPYYDRSPSGSLAVFGRGAASVYAASDNSTVLFPSIPVEPSTCIQFDGAWLGVTDISTAPEKASYAGASTLLKTRPVLPLYNVPDAARTKVIGDVQFIEGFNFRVNISKELIDLEVGTSYGVKMDCSTSFLPPECLDCDELVSYINGVPPDSDGNFRLISGNNIVISEGTEIASFNDKFPEPANKHSLFVGLSFQATDLCAPLNVTPSI